MVGFIFFFTALSSAQNATFIASTERTTVGANEQFEVTFTASGSDLNSMKNFHAPEFGKLVVLTGPSQSTNVQIFNGQMNSSLTLSYTLYAREPGKYTIGAASIEYKGTALRTQPLQIEVVKGNPQQKQSAPDAVNIGNSVFLRATVDKQRAKQGEQLTVTYKLYFNVRVSGYDIARAPVYQGFWSEDLEQSKQPTVTTEMFEGKQYNVAIIRKTALFATQAGKLTIAPLELRCNVQVQSKKRSNDPFDSFFNDPFFSRLQTVEQEFKSNSLPVTIDALPGTSPADYKGAVGKFSFTATVDKNTVQTGDPITLRLSVAGTGNIKLLTIPKPSLPNDFE
ncbi:MAG: protein BatD, partial [Ignavibacteriales bacterium]|nr:protein BatD [Ignavibacteriales bacterium]